VHCPRYAPNPSHKQNTTIKKAKFHLQELGQNPDNTKMQMQQLTHLMTTLTPLTAKKTPDPSKKTQSHPAMLPNTTQKRIMETNKGIRNQHCLTSASFASAEPTTSE